MPVADLTRLGMALLGRRTQEPPAKADGIVLGHQEDGSPVVWPPPSPEHASHVVCLGASGTGKTICVASALLRELIDSAEQDEAPVAHIVVDPKGDLVAALLAGLSAQAPQLLHAVRYLNPFTVSSGGGFPFNVARLARGSAPLDVRALALAGLCASVSTGRGSQAHLGVGARQVEVLENVHAAALGVEDPRASVLLGLDALVLPQGLQRLASITTSTRARQALADAHLSDELRASCAARMRSAYASTDDLERIVAAPSCVQFADLLAPGALTVVDLGQPTGGLLSLTSVWASLLVRLAVEHLLERPSPWQGHHVRLVVDEAHLVAGALADVGEVLLTTGRSRGLSVVALTQGTVLLKDASPSFLQVLLGNSPLRLIGRLAAPDAELLAREQAPGPGVESTRGAVRDRFISTVTNLCDREFIALTPGSRERFRSVDVDLPAWEQARAQHAGTIDALKRRYALPSSLGPRLTLDDLAPHQRGKRRAQGQPEPRATRGRTRWG